MADESLLEIDSLEMADELKDAPAGHVVAAVVTPEGVAWVGLAIGVVVEAWDGQVAFLHDHAPFVGDLGIGELRILPHGGGAKRWFLDGGVVHVHANRVMVLAEQVKPIESLNADIAKADLEKALAELATTDAAVAARDHAIASARARLRLTETGA